MTIIELKEKLGWSTEKLAAELGFSYFTVNKWLMGYTKKPSRLAQEKIDKLIATLEKGEGK